MVTVLTEKENNIYVTLLAEGEGLSPGEYLELNKLVPLFKGDNLKSTLKKLYDANRLISKGDPFDPNNEFAFVRAVSYENNNIIIKSGS